MRAPKPTILRAKALRKRMTPPEKALWLRLRHRQPDQPRFRRQHPCGPYVLDFYCAQARLAVEVDGLIHTTGDHPAQDARRDAYLTSLGLAVLRIPAADIRADIDEVAHIVWTTALDRVAGRVTPIA